MNRRQFIGKAALAPLAAVVPAGAQAASQADSRGWDVGTFKFEREQIAHDQWRMRWSATFRGTPHSDYIELDEALTDEVRADVEALQKTQADQVLIALINKESK